MKLLTVLKFARNAGRSLIAGGGVSAAGAFAVWGPDDVITLITGLTALVGAVTELFTRIIVAKAKVSGKIPLDAAI